MYLRPALAKTLTLRPLQHLRAQPLPALRRFSQTPTARAIPGFDANNPTLRKIQQNPRVMAAMVEAMQLLQKRGLIDPADPKPPGFMKLMQIMGDPEVKAKFMAVQQVLKEEGIQFSPSDLSAFMGARDQFMAKEDKPKESEGVLKRFASSFKKE